MNIYVVVSNLKWYCTCTTFIEKSEPLFQDSHNNRIFITSIYQLLYLFLKLDRKEKFRKRILYHCVIPAIVRERAYYSVSHEVIILNLLDAITSNVNVSIVSLIGNKAFWTLQTRSGTLPPQGSLCIAAKARDTVFFSRMMWYVLF